VQFPLHKLFLMMAAYAVALGAFARLGLPGIVVAALVGTAASALIVVFRKKDIVSVVEVAVGALYGAFLGLSFLSPWMFHHRLTGDIAGVAIGAILGGLVGSWVNRMDKAARERSQAHRTDKP
jgi:hypothetical protein